MDHTYVTDKGRVYRKNHKCLKPNFRYDISVEQNTLGDCLPASTSSSVINRAAPRSQPVIMEQRPNNPILSDPIVVDLTADSCSEGFLGSSNPQVVRESTHVAEWPQMSSDSPPVNFFKPSASFTQLPSTTLPPTTVTTTTVPSPSEAQITGPCAQDTAEVSSTPVITTREAQVRTTLDDSSEL